MLSDARFEPIYPAVRRIAEVRAASVIRLYSLPRQDYADLVQEGLAEVWAKLGCFDPNRAGLPTFVEIIIGNKLISIGRRYNAVKRAFSTCESLSEIRNDLECPASPPDLCLRVDISRVLGRVPAELRYLALILAECGPAQASRETGLSRGALHRRIARIRAAFIEHGLHEYVHSGTPPYRCSAPTARGVHHR